MPRSRRRATRWIAARATRSHSSSPRRPPPRASPAWAAAWVYLRTVGREYPNRCAIALIFSPTSQATKISFTSATLILRRAITHLLPRRIGHGFNEVANSCDQRSL